MKIFVIISVAIAVVVAKPSGVLHPHGYLAYSSPIHESVIATHPEVIHHHGAILHQPIHKTFVAEAPAIVQHSAVVAEAPAVLTPAIKSFVAQGPVSYVHSAPARIHHEAVIAHAPAIVQKSVIAEPPIVPHAFAVAQAAGPVVHHQAVVAPSVLQKTIVSEPVGVKQIVSHQDSSIVHSAATLRHEYPLVHQPVIAHAPIVEHVAAHAPIVEQVVARAPVVEQVIAHAPAVLQKTIVSEPVGVKQTVSHQDSSIVHSGATIHHEFPIVHQPLIAQAPIVEHVVSHAPVVEQVVSHAPVVPVTNIQETLGQYSFGYSSPLLTEVKTVDLPIAPLPVVDTPEVAAAKAAHFAAVKAETDAHLAAVEDEKAASKVLKQEISAISSASVVPSGYSYSYVAEQPIIKSAYIQAVPAPAVEVGPVVLNRFASQPIIQEVGGVVIPGATLTAAGVPFETPEVVRAKAAHLATLQGLSVKAEKPCD